MNQRVKAAEEAAVEREAQSLRSKNSFATEKSRFKEMGPLFVRQSGTTRPKQYLLSNHADFVMLWENAHAHLIWPSLPAPSLFVVSQLLDQLSFEAVGKCPVVYTVYTMDIV